MSDAPIITATEMEPTEVELTEARALLSQPASDDADYARIVGVLRSDVEHIAKFLADGNGAMVAYCVRSALAALAVFDERRRDQAFVDPLAVSPDSGQDGKQ